MRSKLSLSRLTFHTKLLMTSLLLSVIPLLLLGSGAAYIASSAIQKEANAKHEATLNQIKQQIDTLLKQLDYLSIQIAGDLTIEDSARLGISMDDRETLDTTLNMVQTIRKYRTASPISFQAYIIYNNYGIVYSNKYGLLKREEFPYYEALRRYEPSFTSSLIIPANTYPNQHDILLARPIGNSSTVDGILFMEIDPTRIYELLQTVQLGEGGQLLVVDSANRIVLSQSRQEIGALLPAPFAAKLGRRNPPESTEAVAYGDESFHVSTHHSRFNDWSYVIIAPSSERTAHSNLIKKVTWFMAGSLILIWGLMAWFASNRLYNPIRALLIKIPNSRTKHSQDGLQRIDAFIEQVTEANQRLDSEMRAQLPQLRDRMLLKLLHGEVNDKEFALQRQRYSLALHGDSFAVCVFEIDSMMAFRSRFIGRDRSLMMYALTKLVEEMAMPDHPSAAVCSAMGQVSLIVGADEASDSLAEELGALCSKIRLKTQELFGFTVSVGISPVRPRASSIHESYLEALELLDFRLLMGRNLTISHLMAEEHHIVKHSARALIKRQKAIVERFAEGDIAAVHAEFEDMLREFPKSLPNSKSVTGIFTHLIGEIDHLIEQLGYEMSQMFEYNVYTRIHEADSLERMKLWFIDDFLPTLQQQFGQMSVPDQTRIVKQIAETIRSDEAGELSLQQAADSYNLSVSQLSRMFKEVMNVNFIDYVLDTRMSRAKKWLVHSDWTIKEIAEKLNYTTPQNFSRAFKQAAGMSPGQFRESARQQQQQDIQASEQA
ncbi:helix-turn-helix domain-containing protein [Paenibacillus chungangensis]|uniref:Helix-turn-helix domain-containing protein n=1 Tax=Paenibacillus chungangensis TaxID=696535 RepID=A0ABW3HNK3_9BACL